MKLRRRRWPARLAGPLMAIIALVPLSRGACVADSVHVDGQQNRAGISIVDNGPDARGVRRFNVQAAGADLRDVLTALLNRKGEQYGVDQDVSGPVDINVKDVTLDEAIKQVAELASPRVKIQRQGKVVRVSLAAPVPVPRYDPQNPSRLVPGGPSMGPFGYQTLTAANRPVTIEVPDDHPIPLEAALSRISAQAAFPILLDRRVPQTLTFRGRITQAPLGMVLQTIADIAHLKLITDAARAYLVPTDRFQVVLSGLTLGVYPWTATCPNCGEHLQPGWKYCPVCGRPVPSAKGPAQRPGGREIRRP